MKTLITFTLAIITDLLGALLIFIGLNNIFHDIFNTPTITYFYAFLIYLFLGSLNFKQSEIDKTYEEKVKMYVSKIIYRIFSIITLCILIKLM